MKLERLRGEFTVFFKLLKYLKPTKRKLFLVLLMTILSAPITCKHEERIYLPDREPTELVEFCFPSVLLEMEECYIITLLFFELLPVWYLIACFIMYGIQKLREGSHARKEEERTRSERS